MKPGSLRAIQSVTSLTLGKDFSGMCHHESLWTKEKEYMLFITE